MLLQDGPSVTSTPPLWAVDTLEEHVLQKEAEAQLSADVYIGQKSKDAEACQWHA